MVNCGRLAFANRPAFNQLLNSLNGKQVVISVKPYKAEKTNNQRAYYFGVVCKEISVATGYTRDEVHEIIKSEFFTKEYYVMDKKIVASSTTTIFDKAEFAEKLQQIIAWANGLGIFIEPPKE